MVNGCPFFTFRIRKRFTVVFQEAGTKDGQIIASKCFMLLEFTQKIEVRTGSVREKARTIGGVKSVQPPSPEEATPLGETAGCGDVLRASSTISLGKLCERLRLMAGQRKNLEDWIIRSGAPTVRSEKHMVPVQRLQSCRSQVRDHSSRCGLRYSPAAHESAWIN